MTIASEIYQALRVPVYQKLANLSRVISLHYTNWFQFCEFVPLPIPDIFVDETESSLPENKCFQELQIQKTFENEPDDEMEIQEIESVTMALVSDFNSLDVTTRRAVRQIQQSINTSQCGWATISAEKDVNVLAGLLLEWLENLKIPILKTEDMENVVVNYKQEDVCLSKINLVRTQRNR